MEQKILFGIDHITEYQEQLRQDDVALLTTGAAVNRFMIPCLQTINDKLHLRALFAAEYGIMGEKREGERFSSYMDVWTGLPVHSLYRQGEFRISDEVLESFDSMLVDLPLTGTRYCSYIEVMHRLMEILGRAGKKLYIIDRPNPLGGELVQGEILQDNFKHNSYEYDLPIRFGLTLGELCLMINAEQGLKCEIEVIKLSNWERSQTQIDFKRPWIASQLHFPNYENCLLSVGMQLFAGTNISVGRGTPLPFRLLGAPFIDGIQLSASMNRRRIAGVLFNPVYFTPTADIYQGVKCQGVQINITDLDKLDPYRLGVEFMAELAYLVEADLNFLPDYQVQNRQEPYVIDHLFGSDLLRRQPRDFERILKYSEQSAQQFNERRKPYLLYD